MGERVYVSSGAPSDPPPIDYGRADPIGDRARPVTAFFRERFDGMLQFLGSILAILGGPRRAGFAATLAMLAGGLGACLAHGVAEGGVFWMTVGGFCLGLYLRVPGGT